MSKIHSAGGERNEIFIFPIFSTTKPSLYQNKHEKSVKKQSALPKNAIFSTQNYKQKTFIPSPTTSINMGPT